MSQPESARLKALEEMKARYPWEKRWRQLLKQEVEIIYAFIKENDHLSRQDFEFKVNRFFLDKPDKPKNWSLIDELLVNVNSHSK